jgi:hypothetical protein
MHTFVQFHHQKKSGYVCAPWSGVLVLGLALAAPAAYAGMGAGTGGGGSSAGAGAGGGGAGAAAGTAGGGGGGGTVHRPNGQTELTTCRPGMVWDSKNQRCLARHSAVLPQRELTEFEFAHAKEPSARR